jgi:hypothetical protein
MQIPWTAMLDGQAVWNEPATPPLEEVAEPNTPIPPAEEVSPKTPVPPPAVATPWMALDPEASQVLVALMMSF